MQFLRRKQNFLWVLTALLCLSCILPVPAAAASYDFLGLDSDAAILMDAETGQVLYEKNGYQQMYPASITKVMTGLLALDALEPQTVLTVSQSAVDAVPITSSHVSLEPGEELTVEQAMYALALMSANDAANVLGEAVSGSLEAFGERMTEKAAELGARNTHFVNANGLPNSQHYTTAYDMALITAEALRTPGFLHYFSTTQYRMDATNLSNARNFENKNRMFSQYYYDGVLMSKTGWTSSALGTLVTAVRQGDTTLVAVVMHSLLLESKYQDTRKLFDYGFGQYERMELSGEALAERLPMGDYYPIAGQKAAWLVPAGTEADAVSVSLAEGMDLLSASSAQTAIIVNASLGDTPLPSTDLILVRNDADQEVIDAAAAMVAAAPTQPEVFTIQRVERSSPKLWIAGVLAIPALLVLDMIYVRQHNRKLRKRRLEDRIRRMKKKMEPDE